MKTCVADALNDLRDSSDVRTFEYPFEFLALLLEASNITHIYGSGNLFDMYPQYADQRLSLTEQAELLQQLLPFVEDPELRGSTLWVCGKMHPEVAFESLIDFAISRWNSLPPSTGIGKVTGVIYWSQSITMFG